MTLSRVVEHARVKNPRSQPNPINATSEIGPTPSPQMQISRLSRCNNSGDPANCLVGKKSKKMFFLGLGCKGTSMPAAPARIIRSAADWEAETERRRKKHGRKLPHGERTVNSANVDICCTPPGISFSCDVVPSTSPKRLQHSRVARRNRTISFLSVSSPQRVPNAREISEVNVGRRLEEEWRHNVGNSLYEELLALSEKIGYKGRGLSEEEIKRCLSIFRPADFESRPLLISIDKEWRCSICQEGCGATDNVGRLGCGHCHHIDCIKQWLRLKNECPVCKKSPTPAAENKAT